MKSDKSRRRFLGTCLAGGGLAGSPATLAALPNPFKPQGIFNVRELGAAADGQTLVTKRLQSAIDAAASAGGMVYFPPGTYLSGTLFLKSHVSLYLEAGAVLLGSKNLADFPRIVASARGSVDDSVNRCLLYGENLENVSLLGRGSIDGQGAAYHGRPDDERPFLISLLKCRDVHVADLTFRESPMWVQNYLACENVFVRGLTVHGRSGDNKDGIDINSCQRVFISDCEFYTEDDAICLKSSIARPCRDVTVTNCVISSLCCGLKMGTGSVGGFQNITISNCTIYDTTLSGIALEIVDGGLLENVLVSGIVMRNVKSAIFLRLGNRANPPYKGAPSPGLGSFRNVIIRDIEANGVDKVGCAIVGLPERPIENVTLSNMRIRFEGGGDATDVGRDIPERPTAYPEYFMFGALPAYAFYCRHVKNVRILNTRVTPEQPDPRPALVCDDVEDLRLSDFQTANSNPVLLLRNTRNAWMQSNQAPEGNEVYLRLEGKQTANIRLVTNDLRNSKSPVDCKPEVDPDAVVMMPFPVP